MTTPRSFGALAALAAVPILAAVLALGSAGSGGPDDDSGPAAPTPPSSPIGVLPPGTYAMTVTEGDAPAALAFLEGDWTMEIDPDGDALVTHESGQSVIGRIIVRGSELTLRDIGGQLACPSPTQSGRYTWTETATGLDLALVSDGCDGRRFVLLHAPWTQTADPRVQFDLQPLAPTPYPTDNPRSGAKIELGQLLFFDPVLSGERDVSCATCHHPDFGFTDGRPRSIGPGGEGLGPDRRAGVSGVSGAPIGEMARNAPTVLNAALTGRAAGDPDAEGFQFWDGRALGLEAQALLPIAARDEMRGDAYPEDVALDSVVARLRVIPAYVARFAAAFPNGAAPGGAAIDAERIAMALATYQRELVTRASRFDRYLAGDDGALTETELRGLDLFFDRAACTQCHSGPAFSHFRFEVTGVPPDGPGGTRIPGDDTGREEHTGLAGDRYAFRTPSLRNVELTAPYMHDGVFATLEEVVEFYDAGGRPRHPAIGDEAVAPQIPRPLGLTAPERRALVAFLETLTDPGSEVDPELLRAPTEVLSGPPAAAAAPRSR